MTNEEAIKILKSKMDGSVDTSYEWAETVRMAIRALDEPQRKKGKWIDETFKPWGLVHHPYKCDQCGEHSEADSDFCPNCGADMRTPVETARDIVHKAIDNSVWSDTVDTAKMHNVVDDKYVEMTKKTEESKRCDTCKHEKERWFSRCADCSDYELWESKE